MQEVFITIVRMPSPHHENIRPQGQEAAMAVKVLVSLVIP
jgi:hypothetical protein